MTLTDQAMDLLEEINRPEGKVLRLEPTRQQGVGLILGAPREDDVVLEREGRDLLHVPPALCDILQDAVIDRIDTPAGGPRFGITPAGHSGSDGR